MRWLTERGNSVAEPIDIDLVVLETSLYARVLRWLHQFTVHPLQLVRSAPLARGQPLDGSVRDNRSRPHFDDIGRAATMGRCTSG